MSCSSAPKKLSKSQLNWALFAVSKGITSALRDALALLPFRCAPLSLSAPFNCFLFFRFFFWGCGRWVCGGWVGAALCGLGLWRCCSAFCCSFFVFVVALFSSLPSSVVRALSSARSFGFCGSRSLVPPPSLWSLVVSSVPSGAPVSCGCVGGLCGLARASFPSALVFRASSFGFGRGAFAARSVALVRSVASSPSPLWVSFPGVPCPAGLLPSSRPGSCFSGSGSGSWASLCFAAGLGVPVLVWLPAPFCPPAAFGFVSLGCGWFFRP